MIYLNGTKLDKVYCGLQTIQAIDFLTILVQYLANRGLTKDVTLLQSIDTNCDKLYKAVQSLLKQT